MSLPRRAGAGLGALGLALLPAAPALAAGSITSPSSGTTVERHREVEVRAVVEGGSAAAELRLRDPLGVPTTVATAPPSLQDRALSYVLDTSCPDLGGGCGGTPARNGTWRIELVGGAEDSRELVVRVPPRAPVGVEGTATGPREVVLTWRRGTEPDLTGYVVVDDAGREVSEVGLGACETPSCRHVVAYAEPGPASEVLAVRARRASCPDCTAVLTGASSEPVRVDRPAGPALPGQEAPSPTPPGAPAGPGTPAPSPSAAPSAAPVPSSSPEPARGGSGTASSRALGFGRSGGLLAGESLTGPPPLSGQVQPPLVAPLDGTTFDPALPYGAVPPPQTAPDTALTPQARAAAPLVDGERAARAVAASLVLLLAAGHALRWLRAGSTG